MRVDFVGNFFVSVLNSQWSEEQCKRAAERVQRTARSTAPVSKKPRPNRRAGTYRDSIVVVKRNGKSRAGYAVVADDAAGVFIEARTGNLARALRAASI